MTDSNMASGASTQAPRGQWSSRLAFILAATGSAVGLGNVWKFPYITGENGGGAFVLVYLACIAVIGIPIMMAEVLIGRSGRHNPIASMALMAERNRRAPLWRVSAIIGVIAAFVILSF
ncbi:MAG: sodium-dependent transporter, partial [Marinobacter sp.]|nr:sodium-dependent transporter [Marinobacter sp.]